MLTIFTLYYILTVLKTISPTGAALQDYYWRDYIPGSALFDALEGIEGRYIGQVHTAESLLPATIYPFNSSAVTLGYDGKILVVEKNIKILCAPEPSRFYWEHVDFKRPHEYQLRNVVRGGFQYDSPLLIGKVIDHGEWKIGQVFPHDHNFKGIWVWSDLAVSARYYEFDILKYNSTLIRENCPVL